MTISHCEGILQPAQHTPVLSGDLDATGWSVVIAGGEPEEPLEDIVSSAHQSLEACLQKAEFEGDGKRIARGIALRSLRSVDLEVVSCNNEKVGGISFGPAPSQVADGVERCGDYIGQAVQEMFP